MSLTAKNIRHIVISSDPGNGLAEMFSGYLQHFSDPELSITITPGARNAPAAVQSILKEDGIHAYSGNAAALSRHFDIGVEINDCSTPESRAASTHRYYRVAIPASEDKVAWRACREEMKRLAIAFLGELRSVKAVQ